MKSGLVCRTCGDAFESVTYCPRDGTTLYAPEILERIGTRIRNYQLIDVLGEGAMGQVYRAEHIALAKPVAVKILPEEYARRQRDAERFLCEARAVSQLRHPHIVDVTDFGRDESGCLYFVMEYLEGENLREALDREMRFSVFKAVGIGRQIALALGAAHQAGVVHRDLKPANVHLINADGRRRVVHHAPTSDKQVVVDKEPSFDFVKLLDFGVAKLVNSEPTSATQEGLVRGTPLYMAPEQAQGRAVDHRCDIYAFGVLLYELVTGVVPFKGDSVLEILNGHVFEAPIPPWDHDPELDADTNRTILKCMEKDPERRYQSMDELQDALQKCYTDELPLRDAQALAAAAKAPSAQEGTGLTQELGELFESDQPGSDTVRDLRPSPASPILKVKTLTEELAVLFSDKKDD